MTTLKAELERIAQTLSGHDRDILLEAVWKEEQLQHMANTFYACDREARRMSYSLSHMTMDATPENGKLLGNAITTLNAVEFFLNRCDSTDREIDLRLNGMEDDDGDPDAYKRGVESKMDNGGA